MIPYNTDAPLYHMPIATVGLIVLNTLLFFAVPSSMVEFEVPVSHQSGELQANASGGSGVMLSLEYGKGVKPWQWLTSVFMHADFFHLLFNMIALWAFGLVVEGKVGLLPFLGMFVGIGVLQSAVEQLLMCVYGVGGSLGASAAIFGILGIAIVWAPRNEFEVLYHFGFRMGTTEVPILMFGFLQFAIEVFNISMGQFGVSTGMLHLMGFALGISVGFVWLVRGWVDCEGWDLMTIMKGMEGRDLENERLEKEAAELVDSTHRPRSETAVRMRPPKLKDKGKPPEEPLAPVVVPRSMFTPPPPSVDDFADLFASQPLALELSPQKQLNHLIENGSHQEAVRSLVQLRSQGTVELDQWHLAKLIRDLLSGQDMQNAIPLMAEHIRRFHENRVTLQINLSKVLFQKQRPQKALQVLRSIDKLVVDAKQAETIEGLIGLATASTEAKSQS